MSMNKKKLLYVVEAMGGGVFTYIVELANQLANTYELYILYCERDQTPQDYLTYFDSQITMIKSEHMTRSINPLNDLKAYFEIKKIANDINPDLIHLHSSKAGVVGRLAFNGKKTPMFYTPHGYSFLMKDQSLLKIMLYKSIEKVCAFRQCKIISCSEGEHEESLTLTKNAEYVNNSINTVILENYVDETKEQEFTVFTLGRICTQKNPALFNEVALAMPEVKFIWIGDGELSYELTAPNIEIKGWMERKKALNLAQKSSAFMLTSLWEGLPISLLESMYMKKYCVVSNVIGNNNVIKNAYNGFLCNEVEDFVNAINQIKNSPNAYLIKNAHNDILQEYNIDVMARKYINIYEG